LSRQRASARSARRQPCALPDPNLARRRAHHRPWGWRSGSESLRHSTFHRNNYFSRRSPKRTQISHNTTAVQRRSAGLPTSEGDDVVGFRSVPPRGGRGQDHRTGGSVSGWPARAAPSSTSTACGTPLWIRSRRPDLRTPSRLALQPPSCRDDRRSGLLRVRLEKGSAGSPPTSAFGGPGEDLLRTQYSSLRT